MYQIINGPEACRMFPATNLRPVFKTKLAKVWRALQTPAAFRTWLEARDGASWSSANECMPIKQFVRSLVTRQMEVRGNLDSTITICDFNHGNCMKPTAEMHLPAWVWKFMTGYYEVWADYWKGHQQDTEYIANSSMPIAAVLRLLTEATGCWRG